MDGSGRHQAFLEPVLDLVVPHDVVKKVRRDLVGLYLPALNRLQGLQSPAVASFTTETSALSLG